MDDLTASTLASTPSTKTLSHAAFPTTIRAPQASPAKSATSPRTVGAVLGLTGVSTAGTISSNPITHSALKTSTTQLVKNPTTSSLAAGLPKCVSSTMVTASGLPSAIVTSLAQSKTETLIKRTQAHNLGLLGVKNVIRQSGAISAALGNATSFQGVVSKADSALQKHTVRSVVNATNVVTSVSSPGSPSLTSVQALTAQAGLVTSLAQHAASKESDSITVARLIQQVSSTPQLVGNLLTTQNQRVQLANPRTTTIKIQGNVRH